MKFIVLIGLIVVLAGCASDPAFNSGRVIDKYYQPEKHWSDLEYSPSCGLSLDGKYDCGSFKLKLIHHDQYEEHRIKLENCQVSDKNGNTIVKKDGSEKCFTKWVDVDSDTYNHYTIGSQVTFQ